MNVIHTCGQKDCRVLKSNSVSLVVFLDRKWMLSLIDDVMNVASQFAWPICILVSRKNN